jgi:L-lactate dehydrogenase
MGRIILLYNSDPHSRVVAPYGSMSPRFSPNPLAAGIPTSAGPILIDMSTSTTAHGVCKRWIAAGERAPGPWLVDGDGEATDDPNAIKEARGGAILTLGGMDLAGYGRADGEERWGGALFMQLINPEGFGGSEAFLREISFTAESCRQAPVAPGKPQVRLPGQAALQRRARQLAEGVELHPTIMPMLAPWAQKYGIKIP